MDDEIVFEPDLELEWAVGPGSEVVFTSEEETMRCPRCGLDEEGRGIMCPRSDAPPISWASVLWLLMMLGLFALVLLALAR